jgi:hypothetical protein
MGDSPIRFTLPGGEGYVEPEASGREKEKDRAATLLQKI